MKKLSFLLNFLLSSSFAYAMDGFIYRGKDYICNCFKKSEVPHDFYLDQLPLDVQGKIIKNVFELLIHENNCFEKEKLKKFVLHVPILLGLQFSDEYLCTQRISQSKICGKNFSAQELFCLPQEQRDVFIRMANRPFFRRGNIDESDYQIIKDMDKKSIQAGLLLEVRPDSPFSLRDCQHILIQTGCLGTVISIVTMVFAIPEVPRPVQVPYRVYVPMISLFCACGSGILSYLLCEYFRLYPDKEHDTKRICL